MALNDFNSFPIVEKEIIHHRLISFCERIGRLQNSKNVKWKNITVVDYPSFRVGEDGKIFPDQETIYPRTDDLCLSGMREIYKDIWERRYTHQIKLSQYKYEYRQYTLNEALNNLNFLSADDLDQDQWDIFYTYEEQENPQTLFTDNYIDTQRGKLYFQYISTGRILDRIETFENKKFEYYRKWNPSPPNSDFYGILNIKNIKITIPEETTYYVPYNEKVPMCLNGTKMAEIPVNKVVDITLPSFRQQKENVFFDIFFDKIDMRYRSNYENPTLTFPINRFQTVHFDVWINPCEEETVDLKITICSVIPFNKNTNQPLISL